jgi:hypothetical protein
VVEGCPEFVELLLGDALAIPGQDLVLNLVDGPEKVSFFIKFLKI